MKKLILFLLICVMIILTACSGKNAENDPTDSNSNKNNEGSAVSGENPTEETVDIPVVDMGGKEFKIFASGWYGYEPLAITDVCPDEFSGESLNDSAYERKVKIEDEYNCKITQLGVDVPFDALAEFQKSIQAHDDAYDIGIIRGMTFSSLLTGGYLRELGDLQNIDFNNDWWRKEATEALAVDKKNFGVCGDMTTNEMLAVLIVCFNKGMIRDYGLESPYALVKNGEWTLDKAVEMAKQVSKDLDGDGKMTAEDQWGILYTHDYITGLLNTSGVRLAELDSAGVPQITFDTASNLSRIQNIMTKIYDLTYSASQTEGKMQGPIFDSSRALFNFTCTHIAGGLRKMDVDFGIIPYPKYDKAQPEYLPTVTGTFLPIICIPSTNDDMENTGLFMEAFAYEGKKTVIPAFYDNILKGKVVRDDESEEMIDYIFGNLQYDTGSLLNFGDMSVYINLMSLDYNTNIASFAEANRPTYEAAIKKIMDEMAAN